MSDTVSVKTKETCPRCGGAWEAISHVERGADKPEDGAFSALGIICPACTKSLVNQKTDEC